VGGLSPDTSEEQIKEYFGAFGEVRCVITFICVSYLVCLCNVNPQLFTEQIDLSGEEEVKLTAQVPSSHCTLIAVFSVL